MKFKQLISFLLAIGRLICREGEEDKVDVALHAMAEDSLPSRIGEASALQQDGCDHDEDIGTVTCCGWFHGLCSAWRSHSQGYDTCQVKKYHGNYYCTCVVMKEVKKNVKAAVVAILEGGPKWKTILRRTSSCSSGAKKKKNNIRRMQFQYDPKSYALNFDDGTDKELGDDGVYLDFSARYACPLPLGINNKEYLGLEAS